MSGREIFKDTAKAVSATAISTALGPAGSLVAPTFNKKIVDPLADKVTENMNEDVPRGHTMSNIFNKPRTSRFFAWGLILGSFILFTIIIMVWFVVSPASFGVDPTSSTQSKLVDGFYFSTVCSSTIGYGDITAKSKAAKLFMSFYHIIIMATSIGLVVQLKDRHVMDGISNFNKRRSNSNIKID